MRKARVNRGLLCREVSEGVANERSGIRRGLFDRAQGGHIQSVEYRHAARAEGSALLSERSGPILADAAAGAMQAG